MATATRQAKVSGTIFYMERRGGKWIDLDVLPYRNRSEQVGALISARSHFDRASGTRRIVDEHFDKDNRKRHMIEAEAVVPADAQADDAAAVVESFDWQETYRNSRGSFDQLPALQ